MSERKGSPAKKQPQFKLSAQRKLQYKLSTQRHSLVTKGLLNLSKCEITDLEPIGTQLRLKTLNLSGISSLKSLATLPPQPDLREIIADDTAIDSYAGISRHPRLESISLIGTPISKRPNFCLSVLVLAGPRLTRVNGKLVSDRQRREANAYPIIARFLIENGWNIEIPIPTPDRFRELAKEKGIKIRGVDAEFSNDEAMRYMRPPPNLMKDIVEAERFQTEIEERTSEQTNSDRELVRDVVGLLKGIGINLKERDDDAGDGEEDVKDEEDVLNAVGALCKVVCRLKDVIALDGGSDDYDEYGGEEEEEEAE